MHSVPNDRKRLPRLDEMSKLCNDLSSSIDKYLNFDVESIQNDKIELEKFVKELKPLAIKYSSVCSDTICALFKNASVKEANDLRNEKKEKRSDVKELIANVQCFLEQLGVEELTSNLHSEVSSVMSHVDNVEGCRAVEDEEITVNVGNSCKQFDPTSVHSSAPSCRLRSEQAVALDSGITREQSLASNFNLSVNRERSSAPISHDYRESTDPLDYGISREQSSARHSRSLAELNEASGHRNFPILPQTPRFIGSNSNSIHRNVPDTRASNPQVHFLNKSDENPSSWVAPSIKNASSTTFEMGNSGALSGQRTIRQLNPDAEAFRPPNTNRPTVGSGTPNHASDNFSFTHVPRPASAVAQPSPVDGTSMHLIRQQLFQKSSHPYSGEPHHFNSWMNNLNNRTSGIPLSPWDKLLILEANATKEPLRVIQKHILIGGVNPTAAFTNALEDLRERFGSEVRIANELIRQLESIEQIKSNHQTHKLNDLLDVCEQIQANLAFTDELSVFNTSYGSRQIWQKLPESMQNSWRTTCDDFRSNRGRYPPLDVFIAFLSKKIREFSNPLMQRPALRTIGFNNAAKTTLKTNSKDTVPRSPTYENSSASNTDNSKFFYPQTASSSPQCKESSCLVHENSNHKTDDCRKFVKLPHREKINLLKRAGLCFACLGPHLRTDCKSQVQCSSCKGNHVTSMHIEPRSEKPPTKESSLCTTVCGSDSAGKSCSKTLLVDIAVKDSPSHTLRCYVILDDQSSSSFADPSVADFFKISGPTSSYLLNTLNGSSTYTEGILIDNLVIKGVTEKEWIALPKLLTNSFIPSNKSEIATPQVVKSLPHLRHLAKNFNQFDETSEVLLLIGRDSGKCMFTKCYGNKPPYAHHTPLGWAIVGETCPKQSSNSGSSSRKTSCHEHFSAKTCFRTGLEYAEISSNIFKEHDDQEIVGLSRQEEKFLRLLNDDIHINDKGSIVLPLPFKSDIPRLPDNFNLVLTRTKNTLSRVKKDADKLNECIKVMQKYLDAGHVEMVPEAEYRPLRTKQAWWIPIFPVIHPKKNKLRLVFDSSARYNGTCLNDHLFQGPDFNNKLKDVLLGFRNGYIGFSGDVEAMFHNFLLKPEHRDYLRYFWFKDNDSSKEICQYRARVHVFGNCSSPAIATFGLRYAANSEQTPSHVQNFVSNQFYVDDGMSCADTVDEAVRVLSDTRKALSKYNIRLNKICSSSSDVLKAFPSSELATGTNTVKLEDNSIHTALGLIWNVNSDSIVINVQVPSRPFTPRGVLAIVNSVWDPLGISAPIILQGRILLRKFLCSKNTLAGEAWDEELPDDFRDLWESWKSSLNGLSGLSIPRCYRPNQFGSDYTVELLAFCDASLEGTGYVLYLVSSNGSGEKQVSFVTGHSKIAPKCPLTIPRMELCSALDLAISSRQIAEKLCIPLGSVKLFSDSMIALAYIKNETKRFSRFITRRVDLILKNFASSQWHYVSTDQNPADIASRPQTVHSLKASCWLSGPDLSRLQCDTISPNDSEALDIPETIESTTTLNTDCGNSFLYELFSRVGSFTKIVQTVRLLLSFSRFLSDRVRQRSGYQLAPRPKPSSSDALLFIVNVIQRASFPVLFKKNSAEKNAFSNLSPFLDGDVVRVGGRLLHSDLDYEHKFPLLLPDKHPFVTTLIRHFHAASKHQGRSITLSSIRENGYYIIHASSSVRKAIKDCVICRKVRLPLAEQMMSNLPKDRLDCAPPFTQTGMDVFGPYCITEGKTTRRTASTKKCWAVIFTCMNSRATHIELLPYLDTSSMKNAIRRFQCVRGPCKKFRSDRGTNFTGAKNQESDISFEEISTGLDDINCEWEFTPPKGSHHGGIWERQIRTIKAIIENCLHLLGPHQLTRDDLSTFLQESACVLNNTPLWEYSSHPDDPRPLTPAMLLNLRGNTSTSETFSHSDLNSYASRRWRRVQYLSDQFWTRWRCDYLQTLQKRSKWVSPKRSFKSGDIVLLKDPVSKRYRWPIAKISSVKVSHDGLVRTVNLVTSARNSKALRELTRPVTEIALLVPVSDCDS